MSSIPCRTLPSCLAPYSSPCWAWCFTSISWRWTTSRCSSSAPWAFRCPPATPQAVRPPSSLRWARSRISSSTKLFIWYAHVLVFFSLCLFVKYVDWWLMLLFLASNHLLPLCAVEGPLRAWRSVKRGAIVSGEIGCKVYSYLIKQLPCGV